MKNSKKRHEEIVAKARQILQQTGGIEAHHSVPKPEQSMRFKALAQQVAKESQCSPQAARNNMSKVIRQARGQLENSNWGGKRSNQIGPTPLPEDQKRQKVSTMLAPGSKALAQAIAEILELPGWGHAVDEALIRMAGEMMKVKNKRIAIPLIDGQAIDQEIAESIPCEKCGSKCRYDSKVTEHSYRSFAICTNPKCQHTIEF